MFENLVTLHWIFHLHRVQEHLCKRVWY